MPVKDYATLRLEAPQTSPIGNPAVAVHEVRKLAIGPHPANVHLQQQQQQQYQQQLYQQQQQQQQQHYQQQQQQQQQQFQQQQQNQYLGLSSVASPSQHSLQSPPGSQCSQQLSQLQACARQAL
ncbi:ataxin-8-like, partial [Thrips palmi]|uniref:Ataxin-8-like n=1 Tax=Thrips palmi TaxID=161013 RepID=A0A6P8Z5A0_THRPL